MALNWREIDLILDELPLADSHLQNVRQPDYRSLVLELYVPRYRYFVLISLQTGKTRLHAIDELPPKGRTKPRFVQFLLSRLRGARITSAEQVGSERIVRIDCRRGEVESVVWLRLWGGAANIIVTDTRGTVLDAFFRRPKRNEVSGGYFWASPEDFNGPPKDLAIRDFPGEGSFNRRVASYYAETEDEEERERLLSKLDRQLAQEEERLQRRMEGLRDRADSYADPESQKELGDIIMANLHRASRGDRWLRGTRFESGEEVEIPLDPRLEPHENAERYYGRYKKAHGALDRTRQEIENTNDRLAEVRKKRIAAREVPRDDLEALRGMLDVETQENRELTAGVPGLQFHSGAFLILVGRNARENDELLRRWTKGNDLWLHTRDYAGGFVFVKHIPGKSVPLDTLLDAANLALHFSKGRRAGKADLYYTQVKHLRRARGGSKGLVLPTHEKNITVELDESRLNRLLSRPD